MEIFHNYLVSGLREANARKENEFIYHDYKEVTEEYGGIEVCFLQRLRNHNFMF